MFTDGRAAKRFAVTALWILLLAAGGMILGWECLFSSRATFRRFVFSPIPRSVRNIRVDHCQRSSLKMRVYREYEKHVLVLRFEINEDDLSRIIVKRGFRLCKDFKYTNGTLEYTIAKVRRSSVSDGCKIIDMKLDNRLIQLYCEDQEAGEKEYPAPSWLDLGGWTNGEAYLAGQDDLSRGWLDVSLLIYNKQLGSAHLIKYEESGF